MSPATSGRRAALRDDRLVVAVVPGPGRARRGRGRPRHAASLRPDGRPAGARPAGAVDARERLDRDVAERPGRGRPHPRRSAGDVAGCSRRPRREQPLVHHLGGVPAGAAAAPRTRGWRGTPRLPRRRHGHGVRFAWRNRVVRTLIVALFVGVAFAGLDDVALVFLVRDTLGGSASRSASSRARTASGCSSARSGFVEGDRGRGGHGLPGWVASGVGGCSPDAAARAGGGRPGDRGGNAVEVVAMDTLVQQAVPREMLGRIFGLVGRRRPCGAHAGVRGRRLLVDATRRGSCS